MQPLRDLIQVKRLVTEETESGIYTGDMATNAKPAMVLAVNANCKDPKIGDKVVVDARFMHELEGDEEYLVKLEHVIGIYRD